MSGTPHLSDAAVPPLHDLDTALATTRSGLGALLPRAGALCGGWSARPVAATALPPRASPRFRLSLPRRRADNAAALAAHDVSGAPYADNIATIESALDHACRGHRLSADAADDFRSWARVKLLENDQAILRKFEGRSSLRTYLIAVVQRLFLDWRNAEWGKWRPTADARRLGAVAIELERLVVRDGYTYEEAEQTLVTRTAASAEECRSLWIQLPRRPKRVRVSDEAVLALPDGTSATDEVDASDGRQLAHRIAEALKRAMTSLSAEDHIVLQLRYWSGHTVARIAGMLGEDQKALYRRFARLVAHLRRQLEADGLTRDDVSAVMGRFDDLLQVVAHQDGLRPPAAAVDGHGHG